MSKPYKAKSLKAAEREVRSLRRRISVMRDLLDQFDRERKLMARFAADTPQFSNPLQVWEAKKIRDGILKNL
jgi:hypothetical protein